MEKFFKKKPQLPSPLEGTSHGSYEVNLQNLPADPGLRPCIDSYNCNIRDQVRRIYLQRGPFQPKGHNFKFEKFGNQQRRFVSDWFKEFGSWLEYSIKEESAYCLFCFLFKEDNGDQAGSDTFTGKGFKNWKKKEKLKIHEGGVNSAHNRARQNVKG